MNIWIARDGNGELNLYLSKPYRIECMDELSLYWVANEDDYEKHKSLPMELPTDWFPEVTFENGPVEMEIKIKQVCG